MDIRSIRSSAADALAAAPGSPRRLVLVHTGASLAVLLVLTLINFILTRQIDTTVGLSGIGTRTVLQSIQSLLTIALSAALPFWELGFIRASLQFSRRETADNTTLLEGFRRFWPALRLMLLRSFLYIIAIMACLQVASMVFALTPMSGPLLETMEQLMTAADPTTVDPALLEGLAPTLYPFYIILILCLAVVLTPIFYRLRLADHAIMDVPCGALAAMVMSNRAMKGNCFRFFRLDLSLWWYYLLLFLAAGVSYGNVILAALGVPIDQDAAFFIFYIASLVAQLAVAYAFAPRVQTVYAAAYDHLRTAVPAPGKPKPIPKNLPWD